MWKEVSRMNWRISEKCHRFGLIAVLCNKPKPVLFADFEIQKQAMTADQKSTVMPITTTSKASTSSPLSSFSIPPALSNNPDPNNIEDVEKRLPMSGTPSSVGGKSLL